MTIEYGVYNGEVITGDTLDQSWTYRRGGASAPSGAVPGLLMMFSGGEPALLAIPLRGLRVVGRNDIGGVPVDDACMSRKHVTLFFDGARWHIKDLGSRNGTFLDGVAVPGEIITDRGRVLRIGDTLFGLLSDLRGYQGAKVIDRDGMVIGPTLKSRWDQIERAAQVEDTLHVNGESGTGKELAAREFHRGSRRATGPFIPVNCAAIPREIAERLLFGARKGAYSGAVDNVDGYVQAAHGGTLFLDEIAELEEPVQAKLLRVLETKEVLALGASKGRKVELAICSATHQDLRALVASGKFRADLFFRIARPGVTLPPLRERIEDVPWIIHRELAKLGKLGAHVSLVEACMLRQWPGNVRELIVELRAAAAEAATMGCARVEGADLSSNAGRRFEMEGEPAASAVAAAAPRAQRSPSSVSSDEVLETLRKENGNIAGAARALGWHRTQLRRWLIRRNVDPKLFGAAGNEPSVGEIDSEDDSTPSDA